MYGIVFCFLWFSVNAELIWEIGTPNLPKCNKNSAGGYNANTSTIWIFGGKCSDIDTLGPIFSYNIDTGIMLSHGNIDPGFELTASSYNTINNIVYVYDNGKIHSFNMNTEIYTPDIAGNIGSLSANKANVILDAPTLIIHDETQGMFVLTSDINDIQLNPIWDGPYFAQESHHNHCGIYSNTGYIFLFSGSDTNKSEKIDMNNLSNGFEYINAIFDFNLRWARCVKTVDPDTTQEIIYILGGQPQGPNTTPLNHVYKYDVMNDILIRETNMNSPRENGVAFSINNILYYFGGDDYVLPNGNPGSGSGADTFMYGRMTTQPPSVIPSISPTVSPTISPTKTPTEYPTQIPSNFPSIIPTSITNNPSINPTKNNDMDITISHSIWNNVWILITMISALCGCVLFCFVLYLFHRLKRKNKQDQIQMNSNSHTIRDKDSEINVVIPNNDILPGMNESMEGQPKKPEMVISNIISSNNNENNKNPKNHFMSISDSNDIYDIMYDNDATKETTKTSNMNDV